MSFKVKLCFDLKQNIWETSGSDQTSSRTYFFNSESEVWTEGPSLKIGRVGHACGKIRMDEQSQDRVSVIVAGGSIFVDDQHLTSVEILDPESSDWRSGPELLLETFSSQLVEYGEEGGVILVSVSPSLRLLPKS